MFNSFFTSMRAQTSNDSEASRRADARRSADRCIAFMEGRSYPIENWSMGGVLISADDRQFIYEQPIDMALKFKLRNTIVDVPVQGSVIRKGKGQVALKFVQVASAGAVAPAAGHRRPCRERIRRITILIRLSIKKARTAVLAFCIDHQPYMF